MTSVSPKQESYLLKLLKLSAPVMGLQVLQSLKLFVDNIMCGYLPNNEQVFAALGYATLLLFLLLVSVIGLTVGSVALVARAHGMKDEEEKSFVFRHSVIMMIALSALLAIFGNTFAPMVMEALSESDDTAVIAVAYLRPMMTFMGFANLSILLTAVMRGVGETMIPFVVALVTNVLNVVANYTLIFGKLGFPAMGVVGAAWGSTITDAMNLIILVFVVTNSSRVALRIPKPSLAIDRATIKKLLVIGIPAAADMLILNAAFISVIKMLSIVPGGGETAVSAHNLGLRVQQLAFIPGLAISQTTAALVGNELGASRVQGARAVMRASIVLCLSVMCILALGIVLGTDSILALFNVTPGTNVSVLAGEWMLLLGSAMPVVAFTLSFNGLFQGAGATLPALGMNFVSNVFFLVPFSYVAGFVLGMGPFGVWLGFPMSFGVRWLLSFGYYRSNGWAKVGRYA